MITHDAGSRQGKRSACLVLALAVIMCTIGCANDPVPSSSPERGSNSSTGPQASPSGNELPVALVNESPVTWIEIRPLLAETSGAMVVREIAIDRLLRERLRRLNLSIIDRDVELERQLLLASLAPDPDQAERLLKALRQRRLLGPERFQRLLQRNAMLRAVIRKDVVVTDSMIESEFEKQYGRRYRARLITVDSLALANHLLDEIRKGEPFDKLAAENSTDISAAIGGLLAPISTKDETVPASIREILPELLVHEASPVIPIDNQFAIVQLEEIIQPEPVTLDQVRSEIEHALRVIEERRLMDVLARELLADAEIIILDPDVNQAWRLEQSTP